MDKRKEAKILHRQLKRNWFWMFCGLVVFLAAVFRQKWMPVALRSAVASWPEAEDRVRSFFGKKK